jgi:preprotein translocase subunit YajC
MKIRYAILASVTAIGLSAGAASAQTAAPEAAAMPATPAVKAGDAVLDPQGGAVGTIASVEGDNAIVDTGTHKVTLPNASFAKGEKGLLISATKAQLDQMAAAAQNEMKVQVVVGATVTDTAGGAVGTVKEVGADYAVVETSAKNQVRLPMTSFAKGTTGPVIGATAAQLDAAATNAAATAQANNGGS